MSFIKLYERFIMKKYLIMLCGLLISNSFAQHVIDLSEEKVMCSNYMVTNNSSKKDILKNCKIIEMEKKRHSLLHKKMMVKFIATIKESEIIECKFNQKDRIENCRAE